MIAGTILVMIGAAGALVDRWTDPLTPACAVHRIGSGRPGPDRVSWPGTTDLLEVVQRDIGGADRAKRRLSSPGPSW